MSSPGAMIYAKGPSGQVEVASDSVGNLYTNSQLSNGAGYENQLSNSNLSLKNGVSESPTVTYTSATQTNVNWRGVVILYKITALAAGQTATLQLLGVEPTSGAVFTLAQSSALNATGSWIFLYYPGATLAGTNTGTNITTVSSFSGPLPRSFQVSVIYGDVTGTKNITHTLAISGVN